MNKIADEEDDMVAMRKQFLRDNRERHEADNYEFKRRDNDDKVPSTDGVDARPRKMVAQKSPSPSWAFVRPPAVATLPHAQGPVGGPSRVSE